MTENMNKFEKASAALQGKVQGGAYKKGLAKVNLAAEFKLRDINVHIPQNEKQLNVICESHGNMKVPVIFYC